MSEAQTIQWFPGHMTKTRRKIQASLKLVDAVAEIIDARIPVSSRNPELHKIIENKPRIILMNKCDMADPSHRPLGFLLPKGGRFGHSCGLQIRQGPEPVYS